MKLIAAADLWAPWEQKLVELSSRGRLRSLPNEAIIVAARSQRPLERSKYRALVGNLIANMTHDAGRLHLHHGLHIAHNSDGREGTSIVFDHKIYQATYS